MDNYRAQQPRPPAPEQIHVAVFCALSLESDAVDAVLDEHWDDYDGLYSKACGDSNAYTLGRIGRHNAVLVHLSEMGNVTSAAAAAQCRWTFPNINLALIVGVCGAAPYAPGGEEIILGDAMISDGVIQYDLGHQFPTRFARKRTLSDSLGRPNVEIRSLLAKLRVLRVREALQKKKRQATTSIDSKVNHAYQLNIQESITTDFLMQNIGTLANRTPVMRLAEDHRSPVSAFKGLGINLLCISVQLHLFNTVMKSGEARDSISKQEGVIAFEMESAGIWDFFLLHSDQKCL
ncbi:hypothetical protein LQW54_013238 [Pestalotiopsis sp. IQ-011]